MYCSSNITENQLDQSAYINHQSHNGPAWNCTCCPAKYTLTCTGSWYGTENKIAYNILPHTKSEINQPLEAEIIVMKFQMDRIDSNIPHE